MGGFLTVVSVIFSRLASCLDTHRWDRTLRKNKRAKYWLPHSGSIYDIEITSIRLENPFFTLFRVSDSYLSFKTKIFIFPPALWWEIYKATTDWRAWVFFFLLKGWWDKKIPRGSGRRNLKGNIPRQKILLKDKSVDAVFQFCLYTGRSQMLSFSLEIN